MLQRQINMFNGTMCILTNESFEFTFKFPFVLAPGCVLTEIKPYDRMTFYLNDKDSNVYFYRTLKFVDGEAKATFKAGQYWSGEFTMMLIYEPHKADIAYNLIEEGTLKVKLHQDEWTRRPTVEEFERDPEYWIERLTGK